MSLYQVDLDVCGRPDVEVEVEPLLPECARPSLFLVSNLSSVNDVIHTSTKKFIFKFIDKRFPIKDGRFSKLKNILIYSVRIRKVKFKKIPTKNVLAIGRLFWETLSLPHLQGSKKIRWPAKAIKPIFQLVLLYQIVIG